MRDRVFSVTRRYIEFLFSHEETTVNAPIDVDAIFAALPPEALDPGVDPWGGANLTRCSDVECCAGEGDWQLATTDDDKVGQDVD